MTRSPISYKRHRFPPAIIAHVVWLYFLFPLSLRLVEEILSAPALDVDRGEIILALVISPMVEVADERVDLRFGITWQKVVIQLGFASDLRSLISYDQPRILLYAFNSI